MRIFRMWGFVGLIQWNKIYNLYQSDDDYSDVAYALASVGLYPELRNLVIRKDFPEIWMWDAINANGLLKHCVALPHFTKYYHCDCSMGYNLRLLIFCVIGWIPVDFVIL